MGVGDAAVRVALVARVALAARVAFAEGVALAASDALAVRVAVAARRIAALAWAPVVLGLLAATPAPDPAMDGNGGPAPTPAGHDPGVAPGPDMPLSAARGLGAGEIPPAASPPLPAGCTVPAVGFSEYYEIELVPTRRVTGTGRASGTAAVSFAQTPFGVEVAPDGSYRLTLDVETAGLPHPADGAFVAWVSTPDLSEVTRIGALERVGSASGTVAWNKFLVFVTLEPEPAATRGDAAREGSQGAADDADGGVGAAAAAGVDRGAAGSQETWTGPVVLRGMSRSGMMHTMAGHGPFEQQECSVYGY